MEGLREVTNALSIFWVAVLVTILIHTNGECVRLEHYETHSIRVAVKNYACGKRKKMRQPDRDKTSHKHSNRPLTRRTCVGF